MKVLTGNEIKKILKEKNINTKFISASYKSGSYRVKINHVSIDKELVQQTLNHLETVHRCEYSGEILNGANTFVFVDYSDAVIKQIEDESKIEIIKIASNWVKSYDPEGQLRTGWHIAAQLNHRVSKHFVRSILETIWIK